MATDEQVLKITEPGPAYPSIDELSAATAKAFANAKASPEQLQKQTTDLVVGIVDDLVSGKNPLSSKTLLFNGALIVAGVVGSLYTLMISGDTASAVPFLLSLGTGSINSILRMLTTGPVLTQGMQKILGACVSIPPQQ